MTESTPRLQPSGQWAIQAHGDDCHNLAMQAALADDPPPWAFAAKLLEGRSTGGQEEAVVLSPLPGANSAK